MPYEFRKRYDTLVQDSSYKNLRKWLAGDKGIAILFLGLKLINEMPEGIEVPPKAFYLVLFSICIAIAPLLFFIRKNISFGNYLIAIRLAAISTFYLIFGLGLSS